MRLGEGLRAWFALHPVKRWLRLAALVCLTGFLAVLSSGGYGSLFLALPLCAFGVLSLISADSEAPLIAAGGSALAWTLTQRAGSVTSPLTLLAALLLLAYHCLLTVTAHGPGGAPVAPLTLRRWALRGGFVAAVTVLAWLGLTALQQSPLHAPAWARGAALVALGVVLLGVMRLVGERRGD